MNSMKQLSLAVLAAITLIGNLRAQEMPEMIKVEGGTFKMGSAEGQVNEVPTHQVTLSTFYMAKTETTVLQWKAFCKATGKQMPAAPPYGWNDNEPIGSINWNDAVAYTDWLSKKTGKKYRLPTEAEWEFAARGGNLSTGTIYSGSDNADLVSWNNENSANKTHPVARKKANELGLYDMTGNVWEWTNDIYVDYDSTSKVNPKGAPKGDHMVSRGGGVLEPPFYTRAAMRGESPNREYSFRDLGLRVVCE